jgi:glutamate dehydrogenase (NAD(P)+)
VVVQGFGNVGSVAAKLFQDAGAKVIAVQDHKGIVFNGAGLDVDALISHVDHNGSVAGFKAETVSQDDFWALDCEFLIPAALEGQITAKNAPHIKAKIVVEGANGPTTPEADDILTSRGTLIVPDVIANAGGVTVSYFEWVQDFSSFYWTEPEINHRLEAMMRSAYSSVAAVANEHKVSQRTAAFITACTRILEAREVRGLYP